MHRRHPPSELHALLGRLLTGLYIAMDGDQLQLAATLGRHRTTIHGWETGQHIPNFSDLDALLRLNTKYEVFDTDHTMSLFRLWLAASGLKDEGVLDLVTGRHIGRQLRRARATNLLLRKELAWSRLLREFEAICRELRHRHEELVRLPNPAPERMARFMAYAGSFIEDVILAKVCAFYATCYHTPTLIIRAAVYTLTQQDADYLAIRWQKGQLYESFRREHWYGGTGDPPPSEHRGIVGHIYLKRQGEVIPDISADQRLVDVQLPRQSPQQLNFSMVLAPVLRDDESMPIGVLSFDSQDYTFTAHDLRLVDEVAHLLGSLVRDTQIAFTADYQPPFAGPLSLTDGEW